MRDGLRRSFKYYRYTIIPQRLHGGKYFCQIDDPNGEFWNESLDYHNLAAAVDGAKWLIRETYNKGDQK